MKNNSYDCVNITNVINKLGINITNVKGTNIYVNCPFCQNNGEKNGYMKIDTTKNLYICNKCHSMGSSLKLYSDVVHIYPKDAFRKLINQKPEIYNLRNVSNNQIRDEYYRDLVYSNFLELLELNDFHKKKLQDLYFSEEFIKKFNFKSIEYNEKKKKRICLELQNKGFRLDGIPGFFQDTDFKWTFKSHKGIFIPVTFNNKIQGLRIFLDDIYSNNTTNIWFSSNNEYNGTKAINWPLIINGENKNWIDMYNSNKTNKIIIATEIIEAFKLFNKYNTTVIGVPNNIEKELLLSIVDKINVSEVDLYFDDYSILNNCTLVTDNIMTTLESNEIKVNFKLAACENFKEIVDNNYKVA